MTSKQYHFATLVFQGLSYSEAYRRVYDVSNMTEETLRQKGAEVARNDKVQAKLRELRRSTEDRATLLSDLGREWILEGIMQIAREGDKDSTRLAAFISLGKVAGIDLFRETTRVEKVTRTPEDLDRELQERLAEMAKTINGHATPVESSAPAGRDRRRKPAAG